MCFFTQMQLCMETIQETQIGVSLAKHRDHYTCEERRDYNQHYYPNNKERMQEQRRTPLAVHRRKLNRLKHRYEAQISVLFEKMAQDIAQLHNELRLAQSPSVCDIIVSPNDQSLCE